jgi:hypothetical protein
MRASIFGPISSLSWKANVTSGQPVRDSVRCEPSWRVCSQPGLWNPWELCGPCSRARRSLRQEKSACQLRHFRPTLHAIGEHPQGENFHLAGSFLFCRAIGEDTGQHWNFCNPMTVIFAVELDGKLSHRHTLAQARGLMQSPCAALRGIRSPGNKGSLNLSPLTW